MKKLLLTTALLGASAGMAMADVTVSGSGRFGLVSFDDNDVDNQQHAGFWPSALQHRRFDRN